MNKILSISIGLYALTSVLQASLFGGFQSKPAEAGLDTNQQAIESKDYRHVPNSDFKLGERFEYLAHYGFINAGRGTVSMDEEIAQRNGRDCYHVEISAKTVGMFAVGVKVKDLWSSYIDKEAIMPHEFYRDIEEGKYLLEETTYFAQDQGKVSVLKKKKGKKIMKRYEDIPLYTQDMVSGYYFLRTLSFENLKAGDIISMDAFFENKLYDFKIRYEGEDIVKTKFGKVKAFKLKPIMPDNKLFRGEDAITFWVSNDINRVPVKLDVAMFVGTFELELTSYEGLKEDFSFE